MLWAMLGSVLVGLGALVVLGMLSWRLFTQARSVRRKLASAMGTFSPQLERLAEVQDAARPAGRRTDDW